MDSKMAELRHLAMVNFGVDEKPCRKELLQVNFIIDIH